MAKCFGYGERKVMNAWNDGNERRVDEYVGVALAKVRGAAGDCSSREGWEGLGSGLGGKYRWAGAH